MSIWTDLIALEDLPSSGGKVVTLFGRNLALFQVDGELYVTENSCPHQGGPLGQGEVEGKVVTCPWHDWKYDIQTGCPVITPPLETFEVRIKEDVVQLRIDPEKWRKGDGDGSDERREIDPQAAEVLEKISAGRTLDEVFTGIYEELQDLVPHDRLGLALYDEGTGQLVQVKTRSRGKILLDDGYGADISGSTLESILHRGQPRIIDDLEVVLAGRPRHWTKLMVDEGMASSLTLPLQLKNRPVGVIFFTSRRPRAFTEDHVGLLLPLVGHLSVQIEKGQWVTELTQSHQRYRLLLEMTCDGLLICSCVNQPVTAVNHQLAQWLEMTPGEVEEKSLAELVAGDLGPLPENSDQSPVTWHVELVKKGGERLPVEMRLVAVHRGGDRYYQGLVRDRSEVVALRRQMRRESSFLGMVGRNQKMIEVFELIDQVASTDATVLVLGESGTGKEMVAQAVHQSSPRKDKPFVAVNCGALPENLLEDELFGHVKGAFTGATSDREGRFDKAHGGTIFLDEVGELPLATQVKLLRVLQEGEFEPVGSSETKVVDVRVVAATNRDLKQALADGDFREDLYYRLHVVPIHLPPLRERRDDIPLLVEHFLEGLAPAMGKSVDEVTEGAREALLEYPYPGNLRELENILEYTLVRATGSVIDREHLPPEVASPGRDLVERALKAEDPLAALEGELVLRVVEECDGVMQAAADRLRISRTTLWRKLKRARGE